MKFFEFNDKPVHGPERSHVCSLFCLGPLAFHHQAVGEQIQLSQGCRHAERARNTFRNGLVFSNRPVRIRERIRLRVLGIELNWEGALRVGFTTLPPTARNLPLPSVAIPDLTRFPCHWASPLPESCCQAGSELEFWVSGGGTLYFADKNNKKLKLSTGVDLSKPLWFMIDIYGQTSSIFLLGSQKTGKFGMKSSCPGPRPDPLTISDYGSDHSLDPDLSSLSEDIEDSISRLSINSSADGSCVTCLMREATVTTLPCAHKCLCHHCFPKVLQEFGTCPLCRKSIDASSVVEKRVSGTV